jgi:hypothetical protein
LLEVGGEVEDGLEGREMRIDLVSVDKTSTLRPYDITDVRLLYPHEHGWRLETVLSWVDSKNIYNFHSDSYSHTTYHFASSNMREIRENSKISKREYIYKDS